MAKRYRKGKGKPYKRYPRIDRVMSVVEAMMRRGASFTYVAMYPDGHIEVAR